MINEKDSATLIGFKKLRDENFKQNLLKGRVATGHFDDKNNYTNLLTDENVNTFVATAVPKYIHNPPYLELEFNSRTNINCLILQEAIKKGQKIKGLQISLIRNNESVKNINITTIGRKRIIVFPKLEADAILLEVEQAKDIPFLSEVAAYLINENLIEK